MSSQANNTQLETEIINLQTLLNQADSKNHEVFEDNKLMANQIRVLEQRKSQLHEKVKELQERQHFQSDNRTTNRKEVD